MTDDAAAPAATQASAQTSDQMSDQTSDQGAAQTPGMQVTSVSPTGFSIGPGLTHGADNRAYERKPRDPVYRPLRIFTLDPSEKALDGAQATLKVPYEPLEPGPKGRFFEVQEIDQRGVRLSLVDLEDPRLLLTQGLDPSPSNPQFHQQMLYAVCSSVYAVFRTALGRQISWGFDRPDEFDGITRLRILPHDEGQGANAQYVKESGELRFGVYPARPGQNGRVIPNAPVFTCLSHDIIVHELTHALIDGLRSSLLLATSKETLAFHEGFADLIAIFQHFSYRNVVTSEVRKCRGNIEQAALLTAMAHNFGLTTTGESKLRSPIDSGSKKRVFDPDLEPHILGEVLVSAIFDAFLALYRRKTERYIRLASVDPANSAGGFLNADLVDILAGEASQLASQFLSICVRAIDYCPPVDLQLGEFLRAIITADRDLVPDDRWGYREALIDAFAGRGIYPPGVNQLSEDVLVWKPPRHYIGPIDGLSFAVLRFTGDPSLPASAEELIGQARALGAVITRPENLDEFGLSVPCNALELPVIQSIRTSRRVGPDGQVVFDLVAEVTQKRIERDPSTGVSVEFRGGSTIILDPRGTIRYVISKNVMRNDRLQKQMTFQKNAPAD